MPIKLNIQNRTTITPEFEALLVDLWKQRWTQMNNEILQAGPMRNIVSGRNAPGMAQLKAWVTNKEARDRQKTQLLSLPFQSFSTLERRGVTWLVGLTRPILLTDTNQKRWQGPRYTIYVPGEVLERRLDAKFHFVPEGYELDYARHPHHNATSYGQRPTHPLEMTPNTCWGAFPNIITTCLKAGDIVNLFRSLHLYTSRVDMKSLLTTWRACVQFRELPPEKKR